MSKLRPTGNNLIVKRAPEEEKSPGGIIFAETAREKPHRGTVVAVGPGAHTERGVLIPTECKVGDIVLFGRNIGYDLEHDGNKYLVISEDGVIATVLP